MTKLAIITGGSKGQSTIHSFHSAGWQTINVSRQSCSEEGVINCLLDLNDDNLEQTASELLVPYLHDSVKICLVHNACAYFSGSILDTSHKALNQSWQVNVMSAIILNQIIVPFMQPGSSIIYIGSTLSEMAVPNCLPYVTTKHALIGLMRSTCQDLSEQGIHSCCVCPGFTQTETFQRHLQTHQVEQVQVTQNVAMKRVIKPEEVANFILYCANAPIINGAVLHANLGSINQ